MNEEQYNQLPDFLKNDYIKVGDEYKHAGLVKVKSTADELNTKLQTEQEERRKLSERLDKFDSEKKAEIEAAKTQALEEARSKGDVAAIEKRYKEQMADLEGRLSKEKETVEGRLQQANERTKKSVLSDIATELGTDKTKAALKDLIANRVTIDESGNPVFLNVDGSASSLDMNGFKAEIRKDSYFEPFIKADIPTNGGGNVGGSTSGSATTSKKPQTTQERIAQRKAVRAI